MNRKGISLVVALMVSIVMLISLTGVVALVANQRQSVFGNVSDTRLALLADGGLNCALKWLSSQKRKTELSLAKFPVSGDEVIYTIDGVAVKVKGEKNNGQWKFTSTVKIGERSCEVSASSVAEAIPVDDGSSLEFSGLNADPRQCGGRMATLGANHSFDLHKTNAVTVMCWIKTAPAADNTLGSDSKYKRSNIVSNVDNKDVSGKNFQFALQQDSQNERIEFALKNATGTGGSDGAGTTFVVSSTKLKPDTWYHIAATYDNEQMKIYVNENYDCWDMFYDPKNGQIINNTRYFAYYDLGASPDRASAVFNIFRYKREVGTFAGKGIFAPTDDTKNYITNIGSSALETSDGGWRNFKGQIDDVSIWNRALTQQEIGEYRIGTKSIGGTEDNLQAYWNFEGANSDIFVNKRKKINNNGEFEYDASLNGYALDYKLKSNKGENLDNETGNKLIGQLQKKWTIRYF